MRKRPKCQKIDGEREKTSKALGSEIFSEETKLHSGDGRERVIGWELEEICFRERQSKKFSPDFIHLETVPAV